MRIVSSSLIAALAVSLGACATVSKTSASDGRAQYTIGCGGLDEWGQCYTQAMDLCGSNNYEVLSKKGDDSPTFFLNVFASRTLVVACQKAYAPTTADAK